VVHVTQSIRAAFRAFFARPLRHRTNKTLAEMLRSTCRVRIRMSVDFDGIHRDPVDHFDHKPQVDNTSVVLIYFVRDHVMVYASLSHAESHPLLSSAFHGVHANDSCIRGTVYNVVTRMEQPSATIYMLDMPCDAFFIADWIPEKTESLRDVILCLKTTYTVFR
jgi:hypothetical protein